jgi:hypothetical protein
MLSRVAQPRLLQASSSVIQKWTQPLLVLLPCTPVSAQRPGRLLHQSTLADPPHMSQLLAARSLVNLKHPTAPRTPTQQATEQAATGKQNSQLPYRASGLNVLTAQRLPAQACMQLQLQPASGLCLTNREQTVYYTVPTHTKRSQRSGKAALHWLHA